MYDELAESVALIEAGQPGLAQGFSHERERVPVAVDVFNDVAVTAFARWSDGRVWDDVHVLARRATGWRLLGGGSGSGGDELAERPVVLPHWTDLDSGDRVMGVDSWGGIHDDRGGADRWPWSGRWISWAEVRVIRQVNSVQVDPLRGTERRLAVPWHGRVMVIWTGFRAPRVRAYDGSGRRLGELRPPLH